MGLFDFLKKKKTADELIVEANNFFKAGKLVEGYALYEQAAELGDSNAQFEMGTAITFGKIDRPLSDGIKWLELAVKNNHIKAINNLAICYQQGKGVEKDLKKAFSLYSLAVSKGDAMAEFNVGQAYYFGLGVVRNLSKALECVERAAEAGCVNAYYMLGQIYENGEKTNDLEIVQDVDTAMAWYTKAAEKDYQPAIESLERLQQSFDESPAILVDKEGEAFVRADIVVPDKYDASNPKYYPADGAVFLLSRIVEKDPNSEAMSILMELAGNYFNKMALNQLFSMGKMADNTDDDARQGCASFLLQAWQNRDVEKLRILAFWSYPTFAYSEYDSTNKLLKTINDEKEFVDVLVAEMDEARRKNERIRMRMREENGEYLVDVMIADRMSTFKFIYGEKSLIGIDRYWCALPL